jgi:hypothetical protein
LTYHNTRDPTCPFRTIATYVQQVWQGTIGTPHPIYSIGATIPRIQYTSWCRTRTLNIHLPVYSWYNTPFSLRICPHCAVVADLKHHISQCPHSLAAVRSVYPDYTPTLDTKSLFSTETSQPLLLKWITILFAHAKRHLLAEPYIAAPEP